MEKDRKIQFEKSIVIQPHWVTELLAEDFAGNKSMRGKSSAMIQIKKRAAPRSKKIKVEIPWKQDELDAYVAAKEEKKRQKLAKQ